MHEVCYLQGHCYMLIVDYFSKFIAVENLQNTQFQTVTNKCKKVFSQFGIPKELLHAMAPNSLATNFVHFQKLGTYYTKRLAPITTNPMV